MLRASHTPPHDALEASAAEDTLDLDQTVEIEPVAEPRRKLRTALLVTALAVVLPGAGHLVLRRRIGYLLLGGFLLLLGGAAVFALRLPRTDLLHYLLSTRVLGFGVIACALLAVAWVAVVLRTYWLAMPAKLPPGKRFAGDVVAFLLCVVVIAPFGLVAYVAQSQRSLLNSLFPSSASDSGGSGVRHAPPGDVNAIKKPRINVLLVGSDAGPDRIGTRTDSMVVASVDTRTGQTILFGLPRNIGYAQFPPGSPMAAQFPNGFHNSHAPGDYLLNAVYGYGNDHPHLAPAGPSRDPGLNLLSSSISYMLGLDLDYYIQVNMDGFASIIDALGGLDVNVGPNPIPMGGIGPFGGPTKPFGYIPAGRQHLNGEQALWFARSRTNSTDYVRMGRQRCLLQSLVDQKSPMDVLRNFQAVASATTNSVSTNIPQQVLPPLLTLAEKARQRPLESISFDPDLPDPNEPDGRFDTGRPNFAYMRQVVRSAIAATAESATTTPPNGGSAAPTPKSNGSGARTSPAPSSTAAAAPAPAPQSLSEACSDAGSQ